MEALRLFEFGFPAVAVEAAGDPSMARGERDDATWHEVELFLADRLERDGDLARIQAALALCDASGGAGRVALDELVLDAYRFPRAVLAIERVRELLQLPPGERPTGFWLRFLLEQFDEPSPA